LTGAALHFAGAPRLNSVWRKSCRSPSLGPPPTGAGKPKSEEKFMPTYIVLGQFTEQGIRNVKDTSKRADAAKELAKKLGAKVLDLYWTIGRYDVAFIIEAPDDATITAFALSSGKLGNVRTETLRAFAQSEINQILNRVV
jgi:uncharacterized protein with GYD domain